MGTSGNGSGPEDKTPTGEWAEDAPTVLTGVPLDAGVEPVTKPNDLAPVLAEARAAGRKEGKEAGVLAGYEEGQEDALTALRSFLYEKDTPEDQVLGIIEAVRARLVKL